MRQLRNKWLLIGLYLAIMTSWPGVVFSNAPDSLLSPQMIRAKIAKYNGKVKAVYERVLKHNPGVSGEVTVRFEITPQGQVVNCEILTSTLNQTQVERAIIATIQDLTFPEFESAENMVVVYPYYLEPKRR